MPPSTEPSRRFTGGHGGRGGEGRRGAPYLVPAAAVLAAALAAWLARGRLVSCAASLGSPEAQIRRVLAHPVPARMDDVYGFQAGGAVELSQVRFDDVAPLVEGDRALGVAMLSAEGRVAWRGHEARLSYLGRERFHMRRCAIARWCADGEQLAQLRGVLTALFRLHDSRQQGDRQACERLRAASAPAPPAGGGQGSTERDGGVTAWQIRVERDGAEVGEDLEVTAPGGGAAARERHVYRLVSSDGRWLFVSGI